MKLRSVVRSDLLKAELLRGSLVAAPGIGIIIAGGIWIPVESMSLFGVVCLFLGFALIGAGLIPYRRLARLQLQPHEIHIGETGFIFSVRGKKTLSVPFLAIAGSEYVEKGRVYGVGICLKKSSQEKIIVHDSDFDMKRFQEDSRRRFSCDLFLPYFTGLEIHRN